MAIYKDLISRNKKWKSESVKIHVIPGVWKYDNQIIIKYITQFTIGAKKLNITLTLWPHDTL